MSCGSNRHHFFVQQSEANQGQNPLMTLFSGNQAAAIEALERVYQVHKSAAVRQKPGEQAQLTATAKTQKLFDAMKASGLKPPTHAKDGLPKMSSRFGYAEIQTALDAISKGNALSADSQAVVEQVKARHGLMPGTPRQISAVAFPDQRTYLPGNSQCR